MVEEYVNAGKMGELRLKQERKSRTSRTWIMTALILIIYVGTVLWYTVLKRPTKFQIPQYDLFWSYRKWLFGDLRYGTEIIGNVYMFMPFGFLLYDTFCNWKPDCFKKRRFFRIIVLALAFSLTIESLQFALVKGLAELDDLFSNTLGAVLGIMTYKAFRKLAGERRFYIARMTVEAAFAIICLAVFMFGREAAPIEADNAPTTFCFQIDEASARNSNLNLKGFAFGYDRRPVSPRLFLRRMETGEETELEVAYGAARPDVNGYFRCDYDYTNVGFTASGVADSDAEYEIMIRWPMSRKASTGVYILGSDVHRVPYGGERNQFVDGEASDGGSIAGSEVCRSPQESMRNETTEASDGGSIAGSDACRSHQESMRNETKEASRKEGERSDAVEAARPDISDAFATEGTLLLSRPDYHMWVYQYDGALYWITDEGFHFEDGGMTYIQYRLWTTQRRKLPADCLKNNRSYDDMSGHFEAYELSGDYGGYRVMRRYLPTGYSVTSFLTGCFKDGEWIWANYIRPVYNF
ncbi:MAG: VanZ family protein [Lachnospiraceae bacterium]|nr:VanZ family protein [Lachnospiraceae bacterium]